MAAAVPAISVAAFSLVTLRFAIAFGIAPPDLLGPAAIAVGSAVSGLIAWAARVAPSPAAAVRELDRRAGASGRLVAAHELAGSADPFARAAVEEAAPAARDAAARVPALFPLRRPRDASRVAVLVALVPASMLALSGVRVDLSRPAAPGAEERLAADGERLARIADRLDLPTMAFVVEETRRLLAALPKPAPSPPALAMLGPTPAPTRGASITDPEARRFFEEVLSGATSESVGREIVRRFTEETRAAAYELLEAEFKTRGTFSGSKYEIGPSDGSGDTGALPEMKGAGGGMTSPAFDPKKMKSDYFSDDPQSELAAAIKESFDQYLREFAAQLLEGMEDALEAELSGNAKGAGRFRSPKGLPESPSGMAKHGDGGPPGPPIPAKDGDATATTKVQGAMALGGTQAGGAGAGAGGTDARASDAGPVAGEATGERLDLGGTLDERLARVEVIRRMSGGTAAIEDSAIAEVIEKSSKAAEAEAAGAEDVPEEWRLAIEAYFRQMRGESGEK